MLRFTLENGMRGVVDASGRSDAAAVYVWINVGSADEAAGMEGAAHFVEHMVFKGTRSYGVGEVAAAIETLGGDLNAWTSFDETVFHATVPAEAAVAAMGVLAEMLRDARFDPKELASERTVILEEIRGSEDDPDSVLAEATYHAAWPDHPYGRPVIGTTRSVRGMTRDALHAFYTRNYQPANACVAVAGPVDAGAVRAAATALFAGGGRAFPRPARRPVSGPRRPRAMRRGFEACLVELAFPTPGDGDPAIAALDVLCLALGGGASSPLESRLRLREGVCLSAEAGLNVERDAGMAVVSLHVREGQAGPAIAGAREEMARARAGGLGDVEIERAKAQILAERVFGRETVDGRAHTLAFHTERFGDPEAWRAFDAAVEAITPADVAAAARTWMDPEREVALALVPAGEKVSLARRGSTATVVPIPRDVPAPVAALVARVAATPLVAHPTAGARAPWRVVLDNGVRVLFCPDDGEVAGIRIAGMGGAFAERAASAGRGSAWARALLRGAGDLDAVGYATAVETLAGSVSASSGRSSQAVRGEFLASRFLEGLGLVADALMAPRFDEVEVNRVRDELREALSEREDHPEHLLGEKMWAAAYGRHPYALSALGTAANIGGLRPSLLATHHRRWATGANLVVGVAGAFDPDRVLDVLRRTLGTLPAASSFELPALPVRPDEPRQVNLRSGREQAHVALAFPGVALDDAHQPDVDVLAAVLGGQGGRLFVELREAHGLAYSVGAASHEGVHPGLLVCTVATDPERAEEAERRLDESVAHAASGSITAEEVDRARRYILGAIELDLQTASSRANLAAYTELYGQDGLRYRSLVRQRIERVQDDGVRRAAALLLARPLVRARLLPAGSNKPGGR
ncbi:MAG: pitrilysin family protein [Pseudomonadota bacterium]|nr:pitrilysin family protein [Pseudomonadota bacterium]